MKIQTLTALVTCLFFFGCTSNDFGPDSEQEAKPDPQPVQVTYQSTIKPIISAKCQSCHFNFGTLNGVKSEISEILRRTQLSPGDSQLMPKGGPKLAADQIQAFKTWQQNGFPE
ncbi:MAG: hypothetical protein HUU10_00705 [Bacteroidetes bacterium]|nr:hypothetical protein [Bacteroidota bacterium]